MLSTYMQTTCDKAEVAQVHVNSVYSRDFKQDLKNAIDLLLEFKEKLDKLHPDAKQIIIRMVQEPVNRF